MIAGIPIRVHLSMVFLLAWFGLNSAQRGDDLAISLGFLVGVFGCVLLHELGHAMMAMRFGVQTRDIVLYPIGGVARLTNLPRGAAELWIAIAGPLVNLVLVFVGIGVLLATPLAFDLGERLDSANGLFARLILANVMLFLFNLVPAFPMDGGRILRAGLSLLLDDDRGTQIATKIGQLLAVVFGIAGLVLWQSPLLVLIAVFVFLGATQEAAVQRQRSAVEGFTAAHAMITRFETLAPQDTLGTAAHRLVDTHQRDFPVIDAWRRVVGILPRAVMLEGLAGQGGDTAVLEVMDRNVGCIPPSLDLHIALGLLQARRGVPLMVMEGEQLLGMLTVENVSEFIAIQRSTRRGAGSAPRPPIDPKSNERADEQES